MKPRTSITLILSVIFLATLLVIFYVFVVNGPYVRAEKESSDLTEEIYGLYESYDKYGTYPVSYDFSRSKVQGARYKVIRPNFAIIYLPERGYRIEITPISGASLRWDGSMFFPREHNNN